MPAAFLLEKVVRRGHFGGHGKNVRMLWTKLYAVDASREGGIWIQLDRKYSPAAGLHSDDEVAVTTSFLHIWARI
jgi:hypothetical protein